MEASCFFTWGVLTVHSIELSVVCCRIWVNGLLVSSLLIFISSSSFKLIKKYIHVVIILRISREVSTHVVSCRITIKRMIIYFWKSYTIYLIMRYTSVGWIWFDIFSIDLWVFNVKICFCDLIQNFINNSNANQGDTMKTWVYKAIQIMM